MVSDPDEVERILGRPVRPVAIPGTEEVAFVSDIAVDEILPAWQQAREHVRALGRWPVVIAGFGSGAVDEDVIALGWPEGHAPAAIIEDALRTPFEDALATFRPSYEWWQGERWPTWVELQLVGTARRLGTAPSLPEALSAIEPPDVLALERWLVAWEEERRPTTDAEPGDHLIWFEPPETDGLAVLLLPALASEDVAVFVPCLESVYTAEGRIALAAVLRSWRERFGAEVVASWGTMLQLIVSRPPRALDQALELAIEQDRVAGDTLAGRVELRNHARALLGRKTWFLHSRP